MKPILVFALCGLLATPVPSLSGAQETSEWHTRTVAVGAGLTTGPLARAVEREAVRLAAGQADPKQPGEAKPSPKPSGNWFMRHPVKYGALIGAGAGLAIGIVGAAAVSCEPPSTCSTAGVGIVAWPILLAPVGALVGQVVAWSK